MISILIASTAGYAGRTFISLGLGVKLKEHDYSVAYIKPLGKAPVKKGDLVCDADALFVNEALGLAEPAGTICPFVQTDEAQALLYQGDKQDRNKEFLAAHRSFKDRDFVIIGGAGDLFDGSLRRLDALSLAKELKARVLVVEPWRGDLSADALYGAATLFGDRFLGGVLNKVPDAMLDHVKQRVKPFLEKKGVTLFGAIRHDKFLEAVTVRELNQSLNGKVLCCDQNLDELVENIQIGAMDVDNALNYFHRTPNKAVITGAHRSDIQLAALETSTKCIILTGGLQTNEVVLVKARARGVPILSVPDDTFTAIGKIEHCMSRTTIHDAKKMGRVQELFNAGFDMFGFLRKLGKV